MRRWEHMSVRIGLMDRRQVRNDAAGICILAGQATDSLRSDILSASFLAPRLISHTTSLVQIDMRNLDRECNNLHLLTSMSGLTSSRGAAGESKSSDQPHSKIRGR